MYFLKRIVWMAPLLLLITLIAFVLLHLAPGGPFDKERTPSSPEIERQLKAKFHLDEPIWKQYGRYLAGLLQGDFGPSTKYRNHTVNDIIAQGLPISLTLGALAFCFALGMGVPWGIFLALRKGHWDEYAGSLLAFVAVCVPSLVAGPLLISVFSIKLKWFPVAQWGTPWHAVLPALTLGLYFAGRIARLMQEGMLTVLRSEFLITARAKGLSEGAVLMRHALPLAILPVLSYSGPLLADLLTGSFVVENIFQIPGIGVFLVNSSLNRDYTMAVGLVVLYAVLLLGLNLLIDFVYTVLDPRVKYE